MSTGPSLVSSTVGPSGPGSCGRTWREVECGLLRGPAAKGSCGRSAALSGTRWPIESPAPSLAGALALLQAEVHLHSNLPQRAASPSSVQGALEGGRKPAFTRPSSAAAEVGGGMCAGT